eukprot:COSAG05_NODE_27889_length_140_cov_826.536585_1_plen_32_part_01
MNILGASRIEIRKGREGGEGVPGGAAGVAVVD